MEKDGAQGDTLRCIKKEYPNYDVIIFNLIHKVNLDLVHPELIKEYYTQESSFIYPKS